MNRDNVFCRFIENSGKLQKLIHAEKGTPQSECSSSICSLQNSFLVPVISYGFRKWIMD